MDGGIGVIQLPTQAQPIGQTAGPWNRAWYEWAWRINDAVNSGGGGGGGGAPTNATYVTLSLDATLTNERVLTAGSGITVTDGGANGPVTIAWAGTSGTVTIDFGGSPAAETDVASVTVADAGVLAGSEIVVSLQYVATADHTADEALISEVQLVPGVITPGVGFDVHAYCAPQTWGKYSLHWMRS